MTDVAALTRLVRDMLNGRENDEEITVSVSLLWSLIHKAEEARADTAALDVEALVVALVNVEENHLNVDCISDNCDHPEGECPEYSIGCGDAAEIAREYVAIVKGGHQ